MKCELLQHWDAVLEDYFGDRMDVYMTEGYHGLYRSDTATPVCLRVRGASGVYLLPGILREGTSDEGGRVFESAYGYGGPVSTCGDEEFVFSASGAIERLLSDLGVAKARLRFHPILKNEHLVGPAWRATFSRSTVGIDLAGTPDDILLLMHPKHRNMVNRAHRLGLEFFWDESLTYTEEFQALYDGTMDRLGAEDAYYYGDAYYDSLKLGLRGRVSLGLVLDNGKVVSAAIFFRQGRYSHYHLSGSASDAPAGAGQLLVYGAALALQAAGAEVLHLGGGTTTNPDDSLLRFKQRFGALRFKYHVGMWAASADPSEMPHSSRQGDSNG